MIQYFCHYRAQATRHIISRASLRLPWAMNFCPFGACPSDRMPSPVMWHTTSSHLPHAKKSVAIRCADGASKPSGRQRSKSKQSVKRPIRAHRCNPCFFDKGTPHGFCENLRVRSVGEIFSCRMAGITWECRALLWFSAFARLSR